MKKLLVIAYVWPEPKSSAAGYHMMSILRLFKRNNYLVEVASPCALSEHMHDLESEGISKKEIKLNCSSFDEYAKEFNPDIVLFDRFMMEEQFGHRIDLVCPSALKILDTEDLQFLRDTRHKAIKKNKDMIVYDLYENELTKREIASILRCDISLIISSYEMKVLKNTFNINERCLVHLPFMIDLEKLPSKTKEFSKRQHFMTIGNFRHAPNWDVVLQLQKIWPKIRKRLPNAKLHIYGSYPPPKATALNNPKTGFLIKGWANDAYEVIEDARVCLAPIRFGAGIKGKLLDAMIMQTPSVTSSIGAEGMHDDKPWPGFIENEEDEFVNKAVELYENEDLWIEKQNNAQVLLKKKYDQKVLENRLLSKISIVSKNLEVYRNMNFYGSMLKHHTMKSCKYMSMWIEEKNKKEKSN